jgi:hypothetical protein
MRPSVRSLLKFSAGLVIGAVAGGGLVGWHWNRNFRNWYVMGMADQANVAREIYAGRSQELADRIRRTLPTYVRAVESEFRNGEGRDGAYWIVSDVYKVSGAEVPAELKPILASLPPRGSCRKPASPMRGNGAP